MHRIEVYSRIRDVITQLVFMLFLVFLLNLEGAETKRSLVWVLPFWFGSFLRFKFPLSQNVGSPPDARCGALCSLCTSFQKGDCPSCAFADEEVRISCPISRCAEEKETTCTDCAEVLHCAIFREHIDECPFRVQEMLRDSLPHGGFLVKERHLNESLALFTDRVVRGDFGLMITRQPPEMLREVPALKKVHMIQLSQTETESTYLDPTNLAKLHLTVEQFFKVSPRAVILLEGMEYLIVHNGFDRVLKLIHNVVECAKENSSRFVTLVDSRILEDEELAWLERELILIRRTS